MAKTKIPNPLERRHLIERELPEAQCLKLAEAYLEEGRAIEAVEFLRKAGASDRLAEIRADAVRDGDVFLLRSAATAQDQEPDREEWRAAGEAAAAAGKELFATEARRQADRGD